MTTAATAPTWSLCGRVDPAGGPACSGRSIAARQACLAHLTDADRGAYLSALSPGDDVDHRGTVFTPELLQELLAALRNPATEQAQLGQARFDSATFTGDARFDSAIFTGDVWFNSAAFTGTAWFGSATFSRPARFDSATFASTAWFASATFNGTAWFSSATFGDTAGFGFATFAGDSWFSEASFTGDAWFESATFTGDAWFESATFTRDAKFKAATFTRDAGFRSATFAGDARFDSTTFSRDAGFRSATFSDTAWFRSATFIREARFNSAAFAGGAWFVSAVFTRDAIFHSATFAGDAWFDSAVFTREAGFNSAAFTGTARFCSATFTGATKFDAATFSSDARFDSAVFKGISTVGPLVCAGRFVLSGASFDGAVTVAAAAHRLECRRTRWSSTAMLELRYATVDFAHAVFEYPLTITAERQPFVFPDGTEVAETALMDAPSAGVRLSSLRGVDAAHLVLADIDLSRCLLTGTVHLDQLRLEGACSFGTVPSRTHWSGWHPVRFTERRTLAEEHHWRASQRDAAPGWNVSVFGAQDARPASLAPVYRQLRKSFEDSKNEPGAADFYYGEMEMRRHSPQTPRAERSLLAAYWALSGYGLRATRALVWLLLAMAGTLLAMMLWGLPADEPQAQSTGKMTGQDIRLTTDTPAPSNPVGPLHERVSTERFEKSLRVVLNSVIFRSSEQDLTTTGTYTEMASRLSEPVLLGLAVFAIRGRIKR
ncbi:pentapeptide repeat-containing protein [Streptomyces sp. NPDC060027]|uniref:pentapeptide repeat-containing protein n=1 Tax=Streptomyces sp. NPDC060027 TaxID=3347040 RepID=UPI00369171CB